MPQSTFPQDPSFDSAADRWITRLAVNLIAGAVLNTAVWTAAQLSAELSQPLFPVEGRLLVADRPRGEVEVLAHRRRGRDEWETVSVGVTDSSGRFRLRMHDIGSGLPAGEYAVTVRWRPLVVSGESLVAGPDVIAPDYSRPETSPLRIHAPAAAALATWNVPLLDDEQP